MRYRWSKRQNKYVPVKRRPYAPVLLPHEQRQLKHLKSIARGMAGMAVSQPEPEFIAAGSLTLPGPDKGQDFNPTAPFSEGRPDKGSTSGTFMKRLSDYGLTCRGTLILERYPDDSLAVYCLACGFIKEWTPELPARELSLLPCQEPLRTKHGFHRGRIKRKKAKGGSALTPRGKLLPRSFEAGELTSSPWESDGDGCEY
jgi:hypothetical protein